MSKTGSGAPGANKRVAISALLIVLVVGLVLTGALYVQSAINSIALRLKEIYISLGDNEVTILVTFEVRNPSLLSAEVVRLPFAIELADYPLGGGAVVVPVYVPSSGRTETAGRVQVPYSQLPNVVVAAIKQYFELGKLLYRIYGTVTFRFLFMDLPVAFDMRGDVFEIRQ